MATMKTVSPWQDPRTGYWYLRRHIPNRYRAVSGHRGDTIKVSTGTADRKEALRRWPGLLSQWAAMEAEWERRLHTIALTPERAREIAALWAAWIASGAKLETDGIAANAFDMLVLVTDPRSVPAVWARVEAHTDEALALANIAITPETRPLLLNVMEGLVRAAYADAELKRTGDWQSVFGPNHMPPLDGARARLPTVPAGHGRPTIPAPTAAPAVAEVSLRGLLEGWRTVAVLKPRSIAAIEYSVNLLGDFLGHDDAARIRRDGLIRWRDSMKAAGRGNDTWNNRLSMVHQVLAHGVADGKLTADPTIGLRLPPARTASPLPYSDADAARILLAARNETRPSLRWSHWVMAFTGMRAGEVLQLTGRDVRQEGGIWIIDINEDGEGKSVKTGQRRHVPIHPALVAEGFLDYAATITADAPLFPEKRVDRFGSRGGGAWKIVGKWVREVVGLTDPRLAPDHSWRHRVEDELRAAEVDESLRDAILGHSRRTTGRSYGIRGEALARLARAVALIPVPPGITLPAEPSTA
jgi:integrase